MSGQTSYQDDFVKGRGSTRLTGGADFATVALLSGSLERCLEIQVVETKELVDGATELTPHAQDQGQDQANAGPHHHRHEPGGPDTVAWTETSPVVLTNLEEETVGGVEAVPGHDVFADDLIVLTLNVDREQTEASSSLGKS